MGKFYLVTRDKLKCFERLFDEHKNGYYYVLQESNGYSDIAQYDSKYKNIKIITVLSTSLKSEKRLY